MIAANFRPGDPWPPNSWFNAALREARKGRVASVGPGLAIEGGGLSRVRTPRIWAQLLTDANPYTWHEAIPASTTFTISRGGLVSAGLAQPAYEINGIKGLKNTYQRLTYTGANDWRFQDLAHPDVTPGGGGGVFLANCACPVPATLTMTSADPNCNYGMFQSCTLQYQYAPACFAPLNITGQIFLSTTTFIDRIEGDPFYYWLYCQNNLFSLTRLYCTSAYGSPYRDAALYNWLIGGYGNNCTPFYLRNGSSFPGSDPSCNVTIEPA